MAGKIEHTLDLPTDAMKASLERLRRQERPIARRALALAAEAINSEAQTASPVKTGVLKESHLVDLADPDRPRIGATAAYAAAVHTRHPTLKEWYLGAIVKEGAGLMEKALRKVMAEVKR